MDGQSRREADPTKDGQRQEIFTSRCLISYPEIWNFSTEKEFLKIRCNASMMYDAEHLFK